MKVKLKKSYEFKSQAPSLHHFEMIFDVKDLKLFEHELELISCTDLRWVSSRQQVLVQINSILTMRIFISQLKRFLQPQASGFPQLITLQIICYKHWHIRMISEW